MDAYEGAHEGQMDAQDGAHEGQIDPWEGLMRGRWTPGRGSRGAGGRPGGAHEGSAFLRPRRAVAPGHCVCPETPAQQGVQEFPRPHLWVVMRYLSPSLMTP